MNGRALCNLVYSCLDEDDRASVDATDPDVRSGERAAWVIAAGGEIG